MKIKAKNMLECKEYSNLPPETRTMLDIKYNSAFYTSLFEEVEEQNYIKAEAEFLARQQKQFEAFRKANKRRLRQIY